MIESRFKRSAFRRWFGLLSRAETLASELQELLQRRLQVANDSVAEAKQIIEDLRSLGHELKCSEPDSGTDFQVWLDGDLAIWLWPDSPLNDDTKHIYRIEVLWQKM